MTEKLKILHLEDIPEESEVIALFLKKSGLIFDLKRAETESEFVSLLIDFSPDIILADYALPQFNGIKALNIVREKKLNTPFIFVSGAMGEIQASTLLKGACDYILKDRLERLPQAISRAIEEHEKNKKVKHLSEDLSQSELRFRKFVELSHDSIWQVNKDWIIQYINPKSYEMFGYRPEEMIGKVLLDFIEPVDRERCRTTFHNAMKNCLEIESIELKHKHKSGKSLYVELFASPVHSEKGDLCGYDGNYRDITERKTNEKILALESEKAKLLTKLPVMAEKKSLNNFIYNYLIELCEITNSFFSYCCLFSKKKMKNVIFEISFNQVLEKWDTSIEFLPNVHNDFLNEENVLDFM